MHGRSALRATLRATLVAMMCAALVAGTGVPAQAGTKSVRDTRGDARAAIDITAVTYQNTRSNYSAVVTIPGLTRKPRFGIELMASPCEYISDDCLHEWYAAVGFNSSGKAHVRLYAWEASTFRADCPGISVRVSGKKVTVRVPSDCVPGAGPGGPKLRMRATAYVLGYKPSANQVPSIAAHRRDKAPERIVRY